MITMSVERSGMLTILQDMGRYGYQQYGVPVNGPMDEWSHRLANVLVGNSDNAAALECTLTGPRLVFSDDVLLALCGARMRVTVDGMPVPYDTAVLLRKGAVLDVGEPLEGARLYIAVRGGLEPLPVLGSRSTNVRAGFGGFHGRALRSGDRVPLGVSTGELRDLPLRRRLVRSRLPMVCAQSPEMPSSPSFRSPLRLIQGPQWPAFHGDAQRNLTSESYVVTPQFDRMGMRLRGPGLELRQPIELVSEVTVFGTIQVPPDGQPLVLMADRQSAGGYPKIAYVAGADLPALAQVVAGDELRFTLVTQSEAEAAWRLFEQRLENTRQLALQALRQ